jgi:thymidylate synthase
MHLITGNSFEEVYRKSILEILNHGVEVSPRGTKTYELAPATIVIENARQLLATPAGRNGNYTFQLAEALWMIRGSNDLEEIAHYNAQWRNFEDPDNKGILNGAYGDRLRNWSDHIEDCDGLDQFYQVYLKLKKDPYSRQAVAMIWDPIRDNALHKDGYVVGYSKDIPCTNYFNFQIRDGKLNMWTVMRSNDLHKGTIYDIPNFMIFQHMLAGWLDIEVGKYTHSAASFHIYQSDVENFDKIFELGGDVGRVYHVGEDYGDPRMGTTEFNETLSTVTLLEKSSREMLTVEEFGRTVFTYRRWLDDIKNSWWRSVAALIIMYNYRKLGASEEQFKVFLPYITNEYKKYAETLKEIKKK